MNNEIKLVRYITLRYADPICAMDLSDKYLLYGTMLGTAACYIINQRKLITLSETQEEHVSGVKIQENKENQKDNKLLICIGDEKILSFNSISENMTEIPKYEEINNYSNENDHYRKCDKCFTMLKNNYLVRTFIEFPTDVKVPSNMFSTEYSIKNIDNLNMPEEKGSIQMSNYCVPFDFDGEKYVFIDFLEEKKRMFEIYDIKTQNLLLNFEIEKYKEKIGHISLLQLLKNNNMFIVRDYNICEIRNLNFDLIKSFNNKGYEILAFDIIYEDNNNTDNFSIYVVDIQCNVFKFNNKSNKVDYLLNLNNLDIDQVIKDQKFFSMGYPYYIKVSKQYMAISSDYGCILLQHKF
jgi:hypothetical protein